MIESKDQNNRDERMDKLKKTNKNLRLALICISIIIIIAFSMFTIGLRNKKSNIQGASITETKLSLAELKKEIYPKFLCACCGNTIDKCACGMAKEMKDYINSLADEGLSKDEILITAVKKYGITSLASSSLQEEIKEELVKTAPEDRPKIVIEPSYYNFGDVSQAKGTVSTFFTVKNDGKTDLIINRISTSCGCTTASLGGSSFFGMSGHGGGIDASPPGWTYKIPPGETAKLEVKYDPSMHPDFRGAATRIIYMSSNDPIDFQKQVRIELNQIP